MKPSARLFWPLILTCLTVSAAASETPNTLALENGWRIETSARATVGGARISVAAFDATQWHPASVPTTVLSALVQDGTYHDLFLGTNLGAVSPSSFAKPWWYRREFDVSVAQAGGGAELIFEGINYRATSIRN